MSKKIKVAVAGVGNCFSSLYQGIEYYKDFDENKDGVIPGVMFPRIGGYHPADIKIVAAFDVDRRKVGRPVGEAIFAAPNCARVFCPEVPDGPIVQMGPVFDGVSNLMLEQPERYGFRVSNEAPVDVAQVLRETDADILLNYMPVGSQVATEFYAQACLDAGVAFLNCIPVFIASDPVWEKKFIDAGLPLIGDDMRSQVGASITSQILQEMAFDRGAVVKYHQQINIGGNSDFLNMMDQTRLASKKESKENVIRAQNDLRGIPVEDESLFAGPSTWIPYLKDNKVAHFRLELEGFGGAPIEIDAKLSVQDSENSAGVVIDAIRYLKVASELGVVGALRGPSAWTQKTPPQQMQYADAKAECTAVANRDVDALRALNTVREDLAKERV
jgi:myo-inositol-1-phosphate synthase